MATYNTAFGALPGYKEMVGQQPGQFMQQQPQGDNQGLQAVSSRMNAQQAPAQTFSQMQQQGQARPAPPQPQPYQQYGGSQQAQQARQAMLNQLQQQLAQPTRFDTDAFNQIRQAQAANLQTEFGAQRQMMDEEMARRGLMASSIASGRFGDLAGQQARALADLDAQLLSQAAQTQAGDRLAAMQAGGQFAELAGSQDLSEFEANRVAQAQEFQEALRPLSLAKALVSSTFSRSLTELLGIGQLTGQVDGAQTIAAGQQELDRQRLEEERRQFDISQELERELGVGGLTLDQQRFAEEQRRFDESLEEQRTARLQQFGLSNQELELRAQELQQQAQTQGRTLDLQEARDQAEVDLRSRALVQEAELQGRSLDLQEARDQAQNEQFSANQAAERERFYAGLDQNESQFARNLDEQRTQRLQELGISDRQLALEAQRVGQEDSRLSQQDRQFEAEIRLRTQQIAQQAELEGRSLSIQEARQIADEEVGRARLVEETAARMARDGFTREQIDQAATQIRNQELQFGRTMDFDESIRTAELELRTKQISDDAALRGRAISVDEARQRAEEAINRDRMEFSREELDQRRSEFDRNILQQELNRALQQQLGMAGIQVDQQKLAEAARQFDVGTEVDRILKTRGLDIQEESARAQAELAQQNFLVQMMQALGFDPDILERLKSGDPSWMQRERPTAGQVSDDGAWRWDGTKWVPNITSKVKEDSGLPDPD
jgi:hypothetical protein